MANGKTKTPETKPKTSSGGSGKKPPKRPTVTTGGSRGRDDDDRYSYPKSKPKSDNPYMRISRDKDSKNNKYGK